MDLQTHEPPPAHALGDGGHFPFRQSAGGKRCTAACSNVRRPPFARSVGMTRRSVSYDTTAVRLPMRAASSHVSGTLTATVVDGHR